MRITVTIDDDVLAVARALAAQKGCGLGSALSELARRGFRRLVPVEECEDDAVFAARTDAEAITDEDVDGALADWP